MLIDNAVFSAQHFYTVFVYVVILNLEIIWGAQTPLILPHLDFYPNLSHIYP